MVQLNRMDPSMIFVWVGKSDDVISRGRNDDALPILSGEISSWRGVRAKYTWTYGIEKEGGAKLRCIYTLYFAFFWLGGRKIDCATDF